MAAPTLIPTRKCRACGAIKALLCTTCNNAIGGLRDDPNLCRAAANYLEVT